MRRQSLESEDPVARYSNLCEFCKRNSVSKLLVISNRLVVNARTHHFVYECMVAAESSFPALRLTPPPLVPLDLRCN